MAPSIDKKTLYCKPTNCKITYFAASRKRGTRNQIHSILPSNLANDNKASFYPEKEKGIAFSRTLMCINPFFGLSKRKLLQQKVQ